MSKRTILIGFSWILCAGSVLAVLTQQRQLDGLRAQQEQVPNVAVQPVGVSSGGETVNGLQSSIVESDAHELLQLRSEVTKLTARKRELAGVQAENESLRAQLSQRETNSTSGIHLPPGYIRKSQAQFVGYSTPEDALQSFLAALQHHDVTNVLQVLSPDGLRDLGSRLAEPGEFQKQFFKSTDGMPGMAVKSRQDLPDGSVDLEVEIMPGFPPQKLHLQAFNGQWKLDGRF